MRSTVKKLAFRLYRVVNHLPFNNRKKGKVEIENDGTILLRCRIKSTGDGNRLILRGVYVETVSLFSLAITM